MKMNWISNRQGKCSLVQKQILLYLFLLMLIFPLQVNGGSMFGFLDVCLFSEVKGVVTLKSSPVPGAKVIQVAKYDDKEYTNETMTDAEGMFYFKPMYIKSVRQFFPVNTSISQKIVIQYEDKAYEAWKTFKADYEINSELNESSAGNVIAINLQCDLGSSNLTKRGAYGNAVMGICTWEGQQVVK